MEMTIEGAIHEIERELHSQRYDCGIAQLSTGLCDAMKTAVDTMCKYQKIQEIIADWKSDGFENYWLRLISKEVEDGNDDCH